MEQKELKINIAPDKQQGVFANLALIAHTPTEFVLDFAQLMPGVPQASVVSRVVVTPDQAKKILGALGNNISQYEPNIMSSSAAVTNKANTRIITMKNLKVLTMMVM